MRNSSIIEKDASYEKGREQVRVDHLQGSFRTVVAGLGCECCEWPEGATGEVIESITEDSKGDVVVFTDGLVKCGSKSGWAFTAMDGVTLVRVMEKSGATEVTMPSMYLKLSGG